MACRYLTSFQALKCQLDIHCINILRKVVEINTNLVELNLRGNSFGRAGATEIAHLLEHNTTLRSIHLQACLFGADGCGEIAVAMKKNTTLTYLGLCANSKQAEPNPKKT